MKQKQKTLTTPILHSKAFKSSVIVIGLCLAIAQLGYDALTYRAFSSGDRGATITNLIISSVDNLLKPAVINPANKQVYIPEASIVLPEAPDTVSGVLYSYSSIGANGMDAELHITTKPAITSNEAKLRSAQASEGNYFKTYNPDAIFSHVPELQTCARGYTIHFTANAKNYGSKVTTKQLTDGRTVYVYKESSCMALNSDIDTYIKQLQSY